MHAEFLVLRFIHVVGAIAWVGGGVYFAFFLVPALLSIPALIPQVMEGLGRRKAFTVLPTIGLLVVLSGARLLWIDSAGFSESYLSTATGRAFSIGGSAGILAFIVQVFMQMPAARRLGRIAAALAGSPTADERQRLSDEADRVRRRNNIAMLTAVSLALIAATAMSIARYV
ncbi:MAG: hypothetical protein ABI408_06380 [Gemmatimonadaceae bacterium]